MVVILPYKYRWALANNSRISLTVMPVPVPSLCLVSLIAGLALQADAFEPSFRSVEELLRRPNLEDVNYVPLKWKTNMEHEIIFKVDYASYRKVWLSACRAAGLRRDPRLYTLRVGAGVSMDGQSTVYLEEVLTVKFMDR
jgi:hypothetical protein